MMQNIKEMVVVGGGTAGWITALYVHHNFPNATITLIESSEIGILGAGEGTTPQFIRFLNEVGICIEDIFKHAKGTFKNGIKFKNWNGDNHSYFHGFGDKRSIFEENYIAYLDGFINGNISSLDYQDIVSQQNKVKFTYSSQNPNPTGLNDFDSHGNYALHFDANLLAVYLKQVGVARGIKCIDSTVEVINTDGEDYITSLTLKNGEVKSCDFIFDCTGFKRLIIGQYYKTPWVDYSEIIPNNRAIPFFLKNTGTDIPPYTEAIAMKHGWVWKIPVQDRYGCGYVFDSSKATDEEIKNELEEYFKQEITIPRAFSFKAGCFKDVWVKNCISIGLSSGFIEPLEATSIMVSILALEAIMRNLPGIFFRDKHYLQCYNKNIRHYNDDVLDFIYLHYITKRQDTPYWKDFAKRSNQPAGLSVSLNTINQEFTPNSTWFNNRNKNRLFPFYSFTIVADGLKILNIEKMNNVKQGLEQVVDIDYFKTSLNNFTDYINSIADNSISHFAMIQTLKGKHES